MSTWPQTDHVWLSTMTMHEIPYIMHQQRCQENWEARTPEPNSYSLSNG